MINMFTFFVLAVALRGQFLDTSAVAPSQIFLVKLMLDAEFTAS